MKLHIQWLSKKLVIWPIYLTLLAFALHTPKDSKFNRLALMEKCPNFENLPQGTEKPVTFLIFKPASQFTLVAQSVER